MMADGRIMNTGTNAMKVEAIPVLVCCMANKESVIPRNGPKKAPTETDPMPLLSLSEMKEQSHCLS